MKVKYPRRKYQGRYEHWLLKLYGRKSWIREAAILERFFQHFSTSVDLAQFTVADVDTYYQYLTSSDRSPQAIFIQLKAIDRFWRYLQEAENLPLTNPFKVYLSKPEPKRKKPTQKVSLSDLMKLFSEAGPELRDYLLQVTMGDKPHSINAVAAFHHLRKRVGLPKMTISKIKKSLKHGLWREIIKDYLTKSIPNELHRDDK